MSSRAIAELCGVADDFAGRVRVQVRPDSTSTVTGADGKQYPAPRSARLKVIRAYDALVTSPQQAIDLTDPGVDANMNQMALPEKTMSGREIAELTGKEHKNVLADIRKVLEELGKAAADFSATAQVPGPSGSTRRVEVYNLPKRETLILVSGYSVAMRAKIIDCRQELEAGAPPVLNHHDPSQIARAGLFHGKWLGRPVQQTRCSASRMARSARSSRRACSAS